MVFQKTWFWVAFAGLSILSASFSLHFFGDAFPLVQLDLRMNRSTALKQARQLAEAAGWGPEGFEQTASFGADTQVQNFVELEGGGKLAFGRMVVRGPYFPYQWRVRHFRENETTVTTVRFTPSGTPFGFEEQLPEEQPGAAVDREVARQMAENMAIEDWGIDLSSYRFVEESHEEKPGGRIDHTFVLESPEREIGEGRYRLRLRISGDRLTELTHFVQIPEGFQRRYQEMRSANETIGVAGGVATILIYVAGGCLVGLFFLSRRSWILWKQALFWGVVVALLQALAAFNQWPLAWMQYDTALSYREFSVRQIALILTEFVGLVILLGLTFMAAESLTRKAFPHQIQFWKVWSRGVANTPAILGRTAAGYLLVPLFFAYEVSLYLFSHHYLGWWTPSDALFEPDLLATYLPWLSAVALSLQAGFWEECLFRAVPLATAALIGQRVGKRNLFILLAMVVQAVIFGAGHAPYATQPAYARVLELMLPSLLFGGLYLALGLLPAIVLHFTFDVVWFALPLFVSSAPGIYWNRTWVVLLTLFPLWVVLGAYWRWGPKRFVGKSVLNEGWRPVEGAAPATTPAVSAPGSSLRLSMRSTVVIKALGILGLAAWLFFADVTYDSPPLQVSRSQAVAAAQAELKARGFQLSDDWQVLASVDNGLGVDHRFVWDTAGKETYRSLVGDYLSPPHWRVRFARFSGDVAERAEEVQVEVNDPARIRRFKHLLPESRPGADLARADARKLALETSAQYCDLQESELREVSAEPSRQPERTDWKLTFADLTRPLEQGEARVSIIIAGEEVVDVVRYVHVPEDWLRAQRGQDTMLGVVQLLSALFLGMVVLTGLVVALSQWMQRSFSFRTLAGFFGMTFLLSALAFANRWPALYARFSTSQPWSHQVAIIIAGGVLSWMFLAGLVGVVAGLAHGWVGRFDGGRQRTQVGLAASLAALLVGLDTVSSKWASAALPRWADFSSAEAWIPHLTPLFNIGGDYLLLTALLLLALVMLEWLCQGWTRLKLLAVSLLLLAAVAMAGLTSETVPSWLISSLVLGMVFLYGYILLLRFDLSLVPLTVAFTLCLGRFKDALSPPAHEGAFVGQILAAAAILAIGFLWWYSLSVRRSEG